MVKTIKEHNTQPGTPAETAAFEAAYGAVEEARKQTDVLAADIGRHLYSLRAGDNVCRTNETQATISLEGIETIIDTLLKGRDALLVVLLKSGEADAQSNDAKAVERQMREMRLRANME